jgi:uncharacterized protein (DUF1800 family)
MGRSVRFPGMLARGCALALSVLLAISAPAQQMAGQSSTRSAQSIKTKTRARAEQPAFTDLQKAAHLVDRITFGARPGDLERVKQMGWQHYLDEQLHPEKISDQAAESKIAGIPSLTMTSGQIARSYPPPKVIQQVLKAQGLDVPGQAANNQNKPASQEQTTTGQNGEAEMPPAELLKKRNDARAMFRQLGYKPPQGLVSELQQARLLRAVYSERQLQEVMTDFWMNHFNVFANKGADRWLLASYERDTIRPHLFGKFEDLLKATAESPAMLFYLDNWLSASPNNSAGTAPRRNQISGFGFPRGPGFRMPPRPNQQNPQVANQNQARRKVGINENYAREIMELHTLGVNGGYTQKDVQEVARCFTGWTIRNPRQDGEFFFNPRMHDDGEKVVLGTKIPAGGGMKDAETVIRILAHHPSTARFISTKLARKFVSDEPPASLIDRASQTFLQTDGDIRQVVRTILTSPEFWAADSYRAKIKTPFEMTVSAVRAIGAETNGGPAFHRWIAQMGEPLYLAQPPTGYADTAETWVNTGALLQRMNFALALTSNRIPGTRVDLESLTRGVDRSKQTDFLVSLLLHGEVSSQTRTTLDKNVSSDDLAQMTGLILGSPEFQRQ